MDSADLISTTAFTNEDLEKLNQLFYEYDEDKDGELTVRGLHELVLVSLDNFLLQHIDVLKLINENFNLKNSSQVNFADFLTGYAKFTLAVSEEQRYLEERLRSLHKTTQNSVFWTELEGGFDPNIPLKKDDSWLLLSDPTGITPRPLPEQQLLDIADALPQETIIADEQSPKLLKSSLRRKLKHREEVALVDNEVLPQVFHQWNEDALKTLKEIQQETKIESSQRFSTLIKDTVAQLKALELKTANLIEKDKKKISKKKKDKQIKLTTKRLYKIPQHNSPSTSPSKSPKKSPPTKTKKTKKNSKEISKSLENSERIPEIPVPIGDRYVSNRIDEEDQVIRRNSIHLPKDYYTLSAREESKKKIKKRMNREYFFHQSLTEIYRVRDALHIGEESIEDKISMQRAMKKSVETLKIHDFGREIVSKERPKFRSVASSTI